jgi:hypothetical protein
MKSNTASFFLGHPVEITKQTNYKSRVSTPRKNVCACVGHKKDGEEFKCQIVNKNMAI